MRTTRTTIEQFFFDSKFMTFQCLRNSLRFPMAEESMGTLDQFSDRLDEKLIDFRCSPSTANMDNSLRVRHINHGATTLRLRPLCNLFVIEFLERSGFDGDDGDFHYRNRNFLSPFVVIDKRLHYCFTSRRERNEQQLAGVRLRNFYRFRGDLCSALEQYSTAGGNCCLHAAGEFQNRSQSMEINWVFLFSAPN